MSSVYCPSCRTLNSVARDRCKGCKRLLPGTGAHAAVGVPAAAAAIAAAVAAGYALLLYARWERWLRLFVADPDTPSAHHYAHEAAILLGVLVYAAAAVVAAVVLRNAARPRSGV